MKPGRFAGGCALAALLFACAHTVPDSGWETGARSDMSFFEARRLEMEELSDWDFSGRIAARNGDDGGQATIRWLREGDSHRLELFGPFGGGAVRMEYGPRGATLWDGKDNRYVRENEQALLDEVIGWRVPFRDLNYWLFGLASRAGPAIYQLDAEGNLALLRQSGWEIEFSNYREYNGRTMPGKISATRLKEASGGEGQTKTVFVRLVTRKWSES